MSTLLNPLYVKYIVLHCSASYYGDVATFTDWHEKRGFDSIGYHWVITNCYPKEAHYRNNQPDLAFDGVIHKGRSEQFCGAHAKYHNWESIGVVMTGKKGTFSSKQLYSAAKLCSLISLRFPHIETVKGHHEVIDLEKHPDLTLKTCPDIDMEYFRKWIQPKGNIALESFIQPE